MSNVQQLHDRLTALENETSDQVENRIKGNDARAKVISDRAAKKAKKQGEEEE